MSDDQFKALCNTYGFAPSRALRELLDTAIGQASVVRNSVAYIKELEMLNHQALEALKMMRDQYEEYACPACDHADAAIYALKEALVEDAMQKFTDVNQELEAALAEPVAPVAWRFHDGKMWCYVNHLTDLSASPKFEPLYSTPPQRKPEPNSDYERGFVDGMSEQARRSVDKAVNAMTKCKPLTEEEIKECERQAMVNGSLPFEQRVFFARAVERAHGIT